MIENENSTRAAQIYVLDERRKTQRAKPALGDATIRISLQARVSPQHRTRPTSPERRWRAVSDRLARLPHMRLRADARSPSAVRDASLRTQALARLGSGFRSDRLAAGQSALLVIGLLAAFGLGFLAGTSSHADAPSAATLVHTGQAG
jgi:hypothetical protein